MKNQAGSIEPSELKEVAGLVKQAASVIDQMLDLNTSIDLAATSAITQYRTDARVAGEKLERLVDGAKSDEVEREQVTASLMTRVGELEALVARQRTEIESLRLLLWPKSSETVS